jgi:hypothetical protein
MMAVPDHLRPLPQEVPGAEDTEEDDGEPPLNEAAEATVSAAAATIRNMSHNNRTLAGGAATVDVARLRRMAGKIIDDDIRKSNIHKMIRGGGSSAEVKRAAQDAARIPSDMREHLIDLALERASGGR